MPPAPLARTCVLLALFAAAAESSSTTSRSKSAPPPPTCTPGPPPSLTAFPSDDDVQCAVRWHSWCASQVEAFNAYARTHVSGTHVGLYSNTLWNAAARRMREAGCGKRPEWTVPHHPDAWHGLGTASYGAWGRYWREPGDGNVGGEGSDGKSIGGTASGGSGGAGAGAIWSRTRNAKDPEASSETPDGAGGVQGDDDGEGESDDATYDLFQPATVGKRKPCLPQHPRLLNECREQRYLF